MDVTASNLSQSDKSALIEFKEYVSSMPFHIKPEPNSDIYDPEFLRFLNFYVFDETLTSLKTLRDRYNALPDSVKSPIHIKMNIVDPPSRGITVQEQAKSVINLAQKYLGVAEDNDAAYKINEETTRALRERMVKLKEANPDIDVDFNPNNINSQRNIEFLDKLIKKQIDAQKLTSPDKLNETLIYLWSLKQSDNNNSLGINGDIGELFALRNMLDFMVNANLPSGAKAQIPEIDAPWDKDWTNDRAPDLFFSPQTYHKIAIYGTVDTDTLFSNTPDNPNAELLKQMARNIGIDPDKYQILSEREVGLIAQEMLTYQARELCIEEKDINNAIHRGDFMPHGNDLFLVERGFGFPESMKDEVIKAGTFGERELHYGNREVSKHQSASFAARYGSMDEKFVREKFDLYPDMEEEEKIAFIRSVYESPASFFGVARWNDPANEMTSYERRRQEHYLPNLGAMMEEGKIGVCNAPAPSDPCAVDSQYGDSNCTSNIKSADNPCAVDKQYGDSDCSQKFANQANMDATTSDAIKRNIEDMTGNDAANSNDYECSVDANISPCSIKVKP